jgi:hypothetical protein
MEETTDFARQAGFDAIEVDIGGNMKTPEWVAAVMI